MIRRSFIQSTLAALCAPFAVFSRKPTASRQEYWVATFPSGHVAMAPIRKGTDGAIDWDADFIHSGTISINQMRQLECSFPSPPM